MTNHDIRLYLTIALSLLAAFSEDIFPKGNYKKFKYCFVFIGLILALSLFIFWLLKKWYVMQRNGCLFRFLQF